MKNKASTRNVNLDPAIEEWVDAQIASGWYKSTSEIVREGLRLLREQQEIRAAKLKDLRTAIDEGMNSPAAAWEGGAAIKNIARQRHAARYGQPISQD